MLRAHAVVDAVEPGLQIGEDEMDHRHELFGDFGIAAFGNRMMVVAPLTQADVAAPIVGDDGQSHTTSIATVPALVLRRPRLAMANLDSGGHQCFVVDASALAARPSADPGLIDLDMLFRPTTNTILVRPHHAGAQFVKDAKRSFVSCQPKLPLKLNRRHARRLAGDEIRGPEPDAKRRMTALHDRAGQEAGLASTRTAFQNTGSGCDAEGFTNHAAMRA